MRKVLLSALFVLFFATSALAAPINLTISADQKILTFNSEIYALVDTKTVPANNNTATVITKAYTNRENTISITVFSHKFKSRPYVMVHIHKPAVVDQPSKVEGYQDFDCDNKWQLFNLKGVQVVIPDCAKEGK